MANLQHLRQPLRHLGSKAKGDKYIWSCVLLLALASVLVVYSATGSLAYKMYKGNTEVYLFKQLSFITIGLLAIYFLHRINYVIFSRVAVVLYLFSLPLLFYTTFFGAEINQGSRWIMLPVINMSFQTSDFAKVALFMYLSRQLSRSQDVIKDFRHGFLPLVVPIILTCALIMPANLSNALLTAATSFILLFIRSCTPKTFAAGSGGVGLLPIVLIVAIAVTTYTGKVTNGIKKESTTKISESLISLGRFGTWVSRVQDFMYAKKDQVPYQVQQANIAIANGSILYGLGPGKSRQRNFLPQAYNDFIYSIIIEEYGLLGGAFIIFIYMVFLFRCINIFRRHPYAFGAFLALGLSFSMVIQALANMAVNVNLTPVTGVTLAAGKYGRKLVFIYLRCHRYYFKRSAKT